MASATPYVPQSCDMECAPVSVAEQGKFHHFLRRGGRTRHKGRIERLRGQLAYGFEARTPHQRSSSWQQNGKEVDVLISRELGTEYPLGWDTLLPNVRLGGMGEREVGISREGILDVDQ